MAVKTKINETGDCIYTEKDAIELLYSNPELDISKLFFDDPTQYNNSIKDTGINFNLLQTVPNRPKPIKFDQQMINKWYMPEEYYQIDVKKYLLDKCQTQEERNRVEQEYYKSITIFNILYRHVKSKSVVWGVGRGSSVASFCLFLIGVHKINPLQYDLNITEFLR